MNQYIEQFPGFKQISPTTYKALCPCHDDKNPSLHITEKDDATLMHCFSCGANGKDVCEALGFEPMTLLFDKEFIPVNGKLKPKISVRDALDCLKLESLLVSICAEDLAKGKTLSDEDRKRLGKAAMRINASIEVTV